MPNESQQPRQRCSSSNSPVDRLTPGTHQMTLSRRRTLRVQIVLREECQCSVLTCCRLAGLHVSRADSPEPWRQTHRKPAASPWPQRTAEADAVGNSSRVEDDETRVHATQRSSTVSPQRCSDGRSLLRVCIGGTAFCHRARPRNEQCTEREGRSVWHIRGLAGHQIPVECDKRHRVKSAPSQLVGRSIRQQLARAECLLQSLESVAR